MEVKLKFACHVHDSKHKTGPVFPCSFGRNKSPACAVQ